MREIDIDDGEGWELRRTIYALACQSLSALPGPGASRLLETRSQSFLQIDDFRGRRFLLGQLFPRELGLDECLERLLVVAFQFLRIERDGHARDELFPHSSLIWVNRNLVV